MMDDATDHPLIAEAKRFDPSEYVDTRQVAQRTLTSVSSWAKRRMSGDGPTFIKIGRTVRYRWGDVIVWLERQGFASTSEY
tara:strand:+ start:3368 stop:3610 length:243 start_codon:yes stop_codon:yes gene_type:complete